VTEGLEGFAVHRDRRVSRPFIRHDVSLPGSKYQANLSTTRERSRPRTGSFGSKSQNGRIGPWLASWACRLGQPHPLDLALYLAVWMMPNGWQRLLAESNSRRQR
jgi:hypothetical protein